VSSQVDARMALTSPPNSLRLAPVPPKCWTRVRVSDRDLSRKRHFANALR